MVRIRANQRQNRGGASQNAGGGKKRVPAARKLPAPVNGFTCAATIPVLKKKPATAGLEQRSACYWEFDAILQLPLKAALQTSQLCGDGIEERSGARR